MSRSLLYEYSSYGLSSFHGEVDTSCCSFPRFDEGASQSFSFTSAPKLTSNSVVVVAIAQLPAYYSVRDDRDITLRAWLPVVLNQAVQALGIVTACIPHVKRFLDSLESGIIRVEVPQTTNAGRKRD
jgi:hypothetical protein